LGHSATEKKIIYVLVVDWDKTCTVECKDSYVSLKHITVCY